MKGFVMVSLQLFQAQHSLLTFFLIVLFSACAPIQGYEGRSRGESEVAFAELAYDSRDTKIDQAKIEGYEFGRKGIEILPGKHRYEVRFTTFGSPRDCTEIVNFDSWGYRSCRKKQRYCGCSDYITVLKTCTRTYFPGVCAGDVQASAGLRYAVVVNKTSTSASSMSIRPGIPSSAVSGECVMNGQYDERNTETLDSHALGAYRYLAWCPLP